MRADLRSLGCMVALSASFSVGAQGGQWVGLGGPGVGCNGPINATLSAPEGLYVGGSFSACGDVAAENVARFDGRSWHAIGSGDAIVGHVLALAKFGGELVIGGSFSRIGDRPMQNIARFDGERWQPLEAGSEQRVNALAVHEGELYVGADVFRSLPGQRFASSGRWNGSNWRIVEADGVAVSGSIDRLETLNDTLYLLKFSEQLRAGGLFAHALTLRGGNFSTLPGFGQSSPASRAIARVFDRDGRLAVVSFTPAGNISFPSSVHEWDGTAWQLLAGSTTENKIEDVVHVDGQTYVAGRQLRAGGQVFDLARLTPGRYEPIDVGNAFSTRPLLTAHNGRVVLARESLRRTNAGVQLNQIGELVGDQLRGLGALNAQAPDGQIIELSGNADGVLVSGGFQQLLGQSSAGGVVVIRNGIASEPFPSIGASGLGTYSGRLVAVLGSGVSGQLADLIGIQWRMRPRSIVDGSVARLTSVGADLWVGGQFATAGRQSNDDVVGDRGSPMNHVAAYRNGAFAALPTGAQVGVQSSTGSAQVTSIVETPTGAIIGGRFDQAGGVATLNLARWANGQWQAFGNLAATYPNLAINDLALYRGEVILAGADAGQPVLLRYDGTRFVPLGNLSCTLCGGGTVAQLLVVNDVLYAGGRFDRVLGVAGRGIARFDGTQLTPLDGGVNGTVAALAFSNGALWVGGWFGRAGSEVSTNLARYQFAPTSAPRIRTNVSDR
jgi:trimeric autotransporter adhesin